MILSSVFHTRACRATLLPGVVLILLLAGCNPAPKYAKPPAPTPSAFKEIPPDYREGNGWKLAQPGDDHLHLNWWELYNDPQLNALEVQVQTSNQTVKAAEANFRAARSLVLSVRSALAPTLSVSPSYSRSQFSQNSRGSRSIVTSSGSGSTSGTTTTTGSGTGTTTGTTGSSTTTAVGGTSTSGVFNDFSFPADVSYTLDFWHRIRNTLVVYTNQAQASAADLSTSLLSLEAELATDYFQVRELDGQRAILEDTVRNYRQNLQLTQALFTAGIDSDEEVAQAQTQVDTVRAQLTDVGVARAQYEHAIAMLIGKPAANFALGIGALNPQPPAIPVAIPSLLLERRPDIASAERQVSAANAEIGVVRAAYYPNIAISASGGFETSHFANWFSWPSRFWSIGPNISETILDAGVRRAQNEQARAQYDVTVATYRQTVLTAFQSVEDELSSLRILSQERGEQRTAVTSASRYLDLSLTRFKAGVDSYLNVITAQNTVLTNRVTELQIQLRQMTSSVSLIMALGGGWDASQLPTSQQLVKHNRNTVVPAPTGGGTPDAPNPPPLPSPPAGTGNGQP